MELPPSRAGSSAWTREGERNQYHVTDAVRRLPLVAAGLRAAGSPPETPILTRLSQTSEGAGSHQHGTQLVAIAQ